MQYALELKNIHYAYHTLEGETYALKDITFSVREGEFCSGRSLRVRKIYIVEYNGVT